jgi:uncharacterized protein YabN with tetrapyrrole methylase and pyrophosphatase domain
LGDLLCALANVARSEKLDPEHALHAGVTKLVRRIHAVEAEAQAKGSSLPKLNEKEILAYWKQVKSGERKGK